MKPPRSKLRGITRKGIVCETPRFSHSSPYKVTSKQAPRNLLIEVIVSHMNTPVVPKASPDALPELAAYLAPFASLFRRSTSRESVERYLTGLLTDLERKNCDTIAAAVVGTSTERLQHLLTDATWDPQALDQQRVRALVVQSPPQGLLVLDDTGLPKQGRASVGVARQYSGTLGKIANCQVVVSAHYVADEPASRAPVHWPLTAQLYLPEAWATDRTAAPRSGCQRRSPFTRSQNWRSLSWIRPGRGASRLPPWSPTLAMAITRPSCTASTAGSSATSWG